VLFRSIPAVSGRGTGVGVGLSSYRGGEAVAVGVRHNTGRHSLSFSGIIDGSGKASAAAGYLFTFGGK